MILCGENKFYFLWSGKFFKCKIFQKDIKEWMVVVIFDCNIVKFFNLLELKFIMI